jgi:hypothetical protein
VLGAIPLNDHRTRGAHWTPRAQASLEHLRTVAPPRQNFKPRRQASSLESWNQSPTGEFSQRSLAKRTISKLESATTVARTGAFHE